MYDNILPSNLNLMMSKIFFFQALSLGANNTPGLFELLNTQLINSPKTPFDTTYIIVPNPGIRIWLKDQLTKTNQIQANFNYLIGIESFLTEIYLQNNPQQNLIKPKQLKYIIYQTLINLDLNDPDYQEISQFLSCANHSSAVDLLKAFKLANELTEIYSYYLVYRPAELLQQNKIPRWQTKLWQQINYKTTTLLDVYKYFMDTKLNLKSLIIPQTLFVFNLAKTPKPYMEIFLRLAYVTQIYWYFMPNSLNYYGDLLSSKAKISLAKKQLTTPNLTLNDLYLTNANPLVSNLALESREFTELLLSLGEDAYSFNPLNDDFTDNTYLNILKQDVYNLTYRLHPDLQLDFEQPNYQEPVQLLNKGQLDLNYRNSIKINVCHNQLREVQVMFNELALILANEHSLALDEILITALDIDTYAPYIDAVFNYECILNLNHELVSLPYFIGGRREFKLLAGLRTLLFIFKLPYYLTATLFIELLELLKTNLELDSTDINKVRLWLQENKIYNGLKAEDNERFSYHDYLTHSFNSLKTSLVLGSAFNSEILTNQQILPWVEFNNNYYIPYDNIDNNELSLVNQILILYNLLLELREFFYQDYHTFNNFDFESLNQIIHKLTQLLAFSEEEQLEINNYLALIHLDPNTVYNLKVLEKSLEDYLNQVNTRFSLSGKINCLSLNYIASVPFKHVYVLGLNFGEFPRPHKLSHLNFLKQEWTLSDRNINLEDKQAFLNLILATEKSISFSYIGLNSQDNKAIKPSLVLDLLINALGESFSDFWEGADYRKLDFSSIIQHNSIHPFLNSTSNYSYFWQQVSNNANFKVKDLRWEFSSTPYSLTTQTQFELKLKDLNNTFLYSNANLYKTLNLNDYKEQELLDDEALVLENKALSKELLAFFEQGYTQHDLAIEFLIHQGVLSYGNLGKAQFDLYYQRYLAYKKLQGSTPYVLNIKHGIASKNQEFIFNLTDNLNLEDGFIIITTEFVDISSKTLAKKFVEVDYKLKVSALIILSLLALINDPNIKGVKLKILNTNLESGEFKLGLKPEPQITTCLFHYYIRSLSNPVLIHKQAIDKYLSSLEIEAGKKDLNLASEKEADEKKAIKALQTAFYSSYQNSQLDTLKADPIWSSQINEYFTHAENKLYINDLIKIGQLLSKVITI